MTHGSFHFANPEYEASLVYFPSEATQINAGSLLTYFSFILLAFNFKTMDCPSELVFENLGIAPPGPKQFLIERTRLGW